MKFDNIIMNPPFKKNLHLKVIEMAMKHLKSDGTCVNVSPFRWLQDTLAEYKKDSAYVKYKDSIRAYLKELIIINGKETTELFGGERSDAAFSNGVGIYVLDGTKCDKMYTYSDSIIDKVMHRGMELIPYVEYRNRTYKNFAVIKTIHDSDRRGSKRDIVLRSKEYGIFENDLYDGKTLEEVRSTIKHSVHGDTSKFPVVCFETAEEVRNFYESYNTLFFRYVCSKMSCDQNVPLRYLPCPYNTVNPRTGELGYKSGWTNKDLCDVFGIEGYISDSEALRGSEWERVLSFF